ncbi:MAG: EAL domain-containing protein, partial [Burkholderiaceae bacterium]|nr:EAL domain-containing protein [Burkholderiaceae bacterium]
IVLITEAEPVDAPGPRIVFVNDAFERRTGYSRTEILGQSPRVLQGILTQRDALRRIRVALADWKPVREELINYTKAGEPFWVELDIVAVANDDGWYTHWVAVGRDITERKLTENKLRLSAQVFESSSDGIVITDHQNRIVSVNRSYSNITGYSQAEVVGKNPGFLKADRHGDTSYSDMWHSIQTTGQWAGEVLNRRKSGETYPEWLSITAVKDAQGNVAQHIGILSDLSAKKEALKHIDFLAHYDTLTQLPNHKLLQDRTMLALATAQRTHSNVSLMFIDIDHFQNVNDSLGRPVGNEILKVMASRLTEHLQADDTVCRQGGDEFIVLLPHTDAQGAAHVATRTLALMREPVVLENGQELNLTASIGIAVYPDNGDEFDRLSQYADAALLRAKQDGRNNFKFFNEQMHDSAREVLQIENQLRRALSKGELLLHYQPQVDAVTMQLIGAEALIRWQHPEWGMVSPGRFIPIAENSGQILEIGDWVLRTALRQIADWRAAGIAVVPVAVNLSALQFRQTSLCDIVSQALRDFDVPPQLLELELTERIAMEDSSFTLDQISKLHAMGITLSIDDFGTGYSSLSYLRRYQIDKLKIDQSFVQDLDRETDSGTIVRAIINMAHGMGFKTIAEGVETQAQLDYLRQHGCDEIQGYFFSRPIPAADFERLLLPAGA